MAEIAVILLAIEHKAVIKSPAETLHHETISKI